MNTNSVKDMHLIRNARRLGSIGLYGRERAEIFSKWLGKGKKILELGCRDGSLTALFAEGNEVVGADIDQNALELFEKNLGSKGYLLDLNSEWPFGESEFDAVVASEVLEHLYKPEETVKKVLLSLKPGGLFIGTVPNAFSLANRFRLFMAQPSKTALADPTHVHQFSYKELKSIMEKYFKEAEISGIGRLAPTLGKIMPGMFSFLLVFRCKK
jgi:2-polyprenyl-3-methyl-5-hydroxy-6-metoxy-1,4-benzoquinol methylase